MNSSISAQVFVLWIHFDEIEHYVVKSFNSFSKFAWKLPARRVPHTGCRSSRSCLPIESISASASKDPLSWFNWNASENGYVCSYAVVDSLENLCNGKADSLSMAYERPSFSLNRLWLKMLIGTFRAKVISDVFLNRLSEDELLIIVKRSVLSIDAVQATSLGF